MNQNKRTNREAAQQLATITQGDYLVGAMLSSLALALYAFTAAPGVTMEDSGDFIIGVLTLGIVHQPGYPLYTVLGHLFSLIPLGDPAFRVNFFSAVWGALCLGVMFLNFRILAVPSLHALFSCLSLGFTVIFWSKTAVAEVYSFNAFFMALIVFWLLSYNRDKAKWQWYLAALTVGLSLSNHYPLTILSGLGLLFILDRRDLGLRDLMKGLGLLLVGLSPYLYLFIQAYNPELVYNFGKLTDAGMVLDHIRRKHSVEGPGGTAFDKLHLSLWYVKTVLMNYLLAGVLILAGTATGFIQRWRYRYAFLLAALGPSVGLVLILPIPSDPLIHSYLADFSVPVVLFFSFYIPLGVQAIATRMVQKKMIQMALLTVLLLTQAVFSFPRSSHHNDRLAELWGTELLNSLKPNGILILCASSQFHLYYLQQVKGLRKDVTIYDRYSLWTRENLFAPELLFKLQGDPVTYRRKRELELIAESARPIYYTCKDVPEELNAPHTFTPYVIRVDKKHSEATDSAQFSISDQLLEALVHGYPKSDFWIDFRSQLIFSRLISYFGGHGRADVHKAIEALKQTKFYSDPSFTRSVANDLYFYGNHHLARTFYDRAERLSLDSFSSTDLAVYCNLLANARDFPKALDICIRQERASTPCDTNALNTRQTIAAIYKEKGEWAKVAQYGRKILECDPGHAVARSYLELAAQQHGLRPSAELVGSHEPEQKH